MYHKSVLLGESVDALGIEGKRDGVFVDATFGGGGHSREILARLGQKGRLIVFDQDEDALANVPEDKRITKIRSNFRFLENYIRYLGVGAVDGVIADLGVSSHQFDTAERGFSYRFDSPLDMRMNKRAGVTAADFINKAEEEKIADVLYLYGEIRQARRIASQIVKARSEKPLLTTGDLLKVVQPLMPHNREKKDLARVFQALRIEINHEMDALKEMLLAASEVLAEGGRLSVITYHSLEDRIVKNVMKSGNVEGKIEQDFYGRISSPFRSVNSKVIVPSDQEQQTNPRSRSAKLRVAERV